MNVVPIARALLGAVVLIALPGTTNAQPRASERGGAWQEVDGTTIRIAYGRPGARGRTLFGGVVHWNEVWTPGANWATTLEIDRDVRINNVEVPTGEYSVWLVPRQSGQWTLGLDARTRRFHTQKPDSTAFAVRIPVTAERSEDVAERLTFDFVDFTRGGTTLRLRWGDTVVPLDVRVRSTLADARMDEGAMTPYIGAYSVKIYGEAEPEIFPLRVYAANGHLRAGDGSDDFVEFIPTDEPHVFLMGMLRNGRIFDVEEAKATFTIENGAATGFIVPGSGMPIWMEAERTGG